MAGGPYIEQLLAGASLDPTVINNNLNRIKSFLASIPRNRLSHIWVPCTARGVAPLSEVQNSTLASSVIGVNHQSFVISSGSSSPYLDFDHQRLWPGAGSGAGDEVNLVSLDVEFVVESNSTAGQVGQGDIAIAVLDVDGGATLDTLTVELNQTSVTGNGATRVDLVSSAGSDDIVVYASKQLSNVVAQGRRIAFRVIADDDGGGSDDYSVYSAKATLHYKVMLQ